MTRLSLESSSAPQTDDTTPNNYKYPAFKIDLENIVLTKSPLDDYQRLFFTSLLAKFHAQSNNGGDPDPDLLLDLFNKAIGIKLSTYKSNTAQYFNDPPYFINSASRSATVNGLTKQRESDQSQHLLLPSPVPKGKNVLRRNGNETATKGRKRAHKNNLECFEYQLPDVRLNLGNYTEFDPELSQTDIAKIPDFVQERLCIGNNPVDGSGRGGQLIEGRVVFDQVQQNKVSPPSSSSADSDSKSSDELNVGSCSNQQSQSQLPLHRQSRDANESGTLTKNQEFKLKKMDHNFEANDKLINQNNCILWGHKNGFVFLTGIWRLYQDVMRGLILSKRFTHLDNGQPHSTRNKLLQERCRYEYEYIMAYAFYEPVRSESFSGFTSNSNSNSSLNSNSNSSSSMYSLNGKQRKRHNSRSSSNKSLVSLTALKSVLGSDYDGSGLSPPNKNEQRTIINYCDLHWNNLSAELRVFICDHFRNHMIQNEGVSSSELVEDFDLSTLIQRIRGGYIKIQGTWLPMEVARLICYRFCYPIRYLLVPVFGNDFPRECENWYRIMEENIDKMFESRQSEEEEGKEEVEDEEVVVVKKNRALMRRQRKKSKNLVMKQTPALKLSKVTSKVSGKLHVIRRKKKISTTEGVLPSPNPSSFNLVPNSAANVVSSSNSSSSGITSISFPGGFPNSKSESSSALITVKTNGRSLISGTDSIGRIKLRTPVHQFTRLNGRGYETSSSYTSEPPPPQVIYDTQDLARNCSLIPGGRTNYILSSQRGIGYNTPGPTLPSFSSIFGGISSEAKRRQQRSSVGETTGVLQSFASRQRQEDPNSSYELFNGPVVSSSSCSSSSMTPSNTGVCRNCSVNYNVSYQRQKYPDLQRTPTHAPQVDDRSKVFPALYTREGNGYYKTTPQKIQNYNEQEPVVPVAHHTSSFSNNNNNSNYYYLPVPRIVSNGNNNNDINSSGKNGDKFEKSSNPTIDTLAQLATFYNTNEEKYSTSPYCVTTATAAAPLAVTTPRYFRQDGIPEIGMDNTHGLPHQRWNEVQYQTQFQRYEPVFPEQPTSRHY